MVTDNNTKNPAPTNTVEGKKIADIKDVTYAKNPDPIESDFEAFNRQQRMSSYIGRLLSGTQDKQR